MDWSKGYSARYYAQRVDPATWRDVGPIPITGGSLKRERTGLREAASIDCVDYQYGEQWIRVYLDARQGGSNVHEPLFTGLATSPQDDINGTLVTHTLECYSVLKPADDIVLPRGWYAPAGASGSAVVKKLLEATPAPVTSEDGAPLLASSIIAEDDETNLSMCEKVLTVIGWHLRIDGNGQISIVSEDNVPDVTLDPLYNDVIETDITVSNDWYGCPNVLMAIDDDMTSIARDDSPDSELSTVNRGREIWMVETDCDLSDSESIGDYAKRRLAEEQQVSQIVEYDRRYIPNVFPGDVIQLVYPKQGVTGLYVIESQNVELGHNAKTGEELMKVR